MFSRLLLPHGPIIKVVTPENTLGSIEKLYQRIDNINETFLITNLNKSIMLQPTITSLTDASPLLLTGTVSVPLPKKTHNCKYCSWSIDSTSDAEKGVASAEGFVKRVLTYMITVGNDGAPTPLNHSDENSFPARKPPVKGGGSNLLREKGSSGETSSLTARRGRRDLLWREQHGRDVPARASGENEFKKTSVRAVTDCNEIPNKAILCHKHEITYIKSKIFIHN
ncbi:hypothetical protein KSP39_PZI003776 [Platanthera zijinensis]|uniref:Uncharacterized protein n=1 Tax=Platanthera zijinensis TaxID=2320716 RepID=A0AAP0BXE9_9ASPA